MFKKLGIGMLVIVALMLGVAGAVMAQDPEPPAVEAIMAQDPEPPVDDVCPYGETCGGHGYQGTMHDALAEALRMTAEDLYAAMAEGLTVAELAETQGVELGDAVAMFMAPQIERLEQAVEDGYMSREEADWMIEYMAAQMALRFEYSMGYGGHGMGQGGCGMQGGYGGGHRGGMMGGHHGGMWGGNSNAPRTPFWQSQPES